VLGEFESTTEHTERTESKPVLLGDFGDLGSFKRERL